MHNLTAIETEPTIGNIIDCQRYNSLQRLLGVTAYAIEAAKTFMSKRSGQSGYLLSTADILDAEERWVKTAQKGTKGKSLKLQLKLFQDDKGIW